MVMFWLMCRKKNGGLVIDLWCDWLCKKQYNYRLDLKFHVQSRNWKKVKFILLPIQVQESKIYTLVC